MRAVPAVALVAGLVLAGCGGWSAAPEGGDGRLRVVAGFAPLAEVAARVGGDLVDVRNLTPAGAEPHDLELDTEAVDAVEDADVVVLAGGGFQPALEEVAGRSDAATVDVLDSDGRDDPHVWLDPTKLAAIVERVRDVLRDADPDAAGELEANAAAYVAELEELDADFATGLATCQRRVIVTTHAAFGHLAARYDLVERSIAGASPESEPDPARLAALVDDVAAEGITTVFTEPLVAPDVAETLAREADVVTAVLDPIEGIEDGATYESVMRENLAALRAALGCE